MILRDWDLYYSSLGLLQCPPVECTLKQCKCLVWLILRTDLGNFQSVIFLRISLQFFLRDCLRRKVNQPSTHSLITYSPNLNSFAWVQIFSRNLHNCFSYNSSLILTQYPPLQCTLKQPKSLVWPILQTATAQSSSVISAYIFPILCEDRLRGEVNHSSIHSLITHSPNLKIFALRCFGAILQVIYAAGFIYTVELRFGMSGMSNWWSRWGRPSRVSQQRLTPSAATVTATASWWWVGVTWFAVAWISWAGLARRRESRGLFYFFQVPYWRRYPSPSIWTHKLYVVILHFGLHDPISCLKLKFICVSKKFGPGCVDGEVTIWVMEESGFKVLYNQWKHPKDTLFFNNFFINAITVVYGGWRLLATTSKFIHGTLISHKVSHIKLQHFKSMLPNAMFQLFWSCVFVYLFVT